MVHPSLTVVVPTYKREKELCLVLQDLLAQEGDLFEIIVVDQTQKHTETTEVYLATLKEQFRHIHLENPNLPAARNRGIREARGEIILFVDDDVRLPPAFVSAHAANYEDRTIDAIAGPILGTDRNWKNELPAYATTGCLHYFSACWQYDQRTNVSHAPGGNMSFRREILEKAGGFDEKYEGPAYREESDFFIRAGLHGCRTVYDPLCWLEHPHGFREGGCWDGYDGLPPVERFYNHAYFVLKNFRKRYWFRLLGKDLVTNTVRRATLRHPIQGVRRLGRLFKGWMRAWKQAPRKGYI